MCTQFFLLTYFSESKCPSERRRHLPTHERNRLDAKSHEEKHHRHRHHHHWSPSPSGTQIFQSSGAVWKSRWPSWAPVPNKPYGFCGRKATLQPTNIPNIYQLLGSTNGSIIKSFRKKLQKVHAFALENNPVGLKRKRTAERDIIIINNSNKSILKRKMLSLEMSVCFRL